jgi:UDP-glucose 4-epimerase
MVYGAVDKLPIAENVPPQPVNIYGYHKYIAEKLAEAYSHNYSIQVTILRLFNVYGIKGSGILSAFVEKAAKNEVAQLCGEKQKRDFIHISDVADTIAEVLNLKQKFETYNVGTGIGRTIEDILGLVKEYFPTLSVERVALEEVLYDSIADITKLKSAITFNPDTRYDKIREVIQELRRQM